MEKSTRNVLVVAVLIIAIISVILAFDYFQKQGQAEGYVSTPEGEVPKELVEGFNPIDSLISPDAPAKIDLETMRRYVKQAEDAYAGDENKELREYMISEVAQLAGSSEPCESLSIPEIADGCYFGIAIDTNNASLCEKVFYGRSECFALVAKQTGNAALCENADYEYQICLEAGRKKDMSLCKAVGDFKQYCVAAAFPGCDNKTFTQGTCSDFSDSLPPGDIAECEKMPKYRDICYGWVAASSGNASLCANAYDRENCYSSVGISSNNVNACNLAGSLKDNCIAWVAYNTDNLQLCNNAGSERENCIADIEFKWSE